MIDEARIPEQRIEPRASQVICRACEHLKPASDFDFDESGEYRTNTCRVCVSRRELMEARENSGFHQDRNMPAPPEAVRLGLPVVAAIVDRNVEPPSIHDLADGMVSRLGGLGGFCDFWAVQLTIAAQDKPGSKTVLDGCRHLAGLVHQSSQLRQQAGDMSTMSEDDLERILVEHMRRTAIPNEPRAITAGEPMPAPNGASG